MCCPHKDYFSVFVGRNSINVRIFAHNGQKIEKWDAFPPKNGRKCKKKAKTAFFIKKCVYLRGIFFFGGGSYEKTIDWRFILGDDYCWLCR